MSEVVHQTQKEHSRTRHNHGKGSRITMSCHYEAGERPDHDGDAAERRHGMLVPAIVLRVRKGPKVPGDTSNERRRDDDEYGCERGDGEEIEGDSRHWTEDDELSAGETAGAPPRVSNRVCRYMASVS